jgi:anti-anti-sigma factor
MRVMEGSAIAPEPTSQPVEPMPATGLRRIEDWLVTQLEGGRTSDPRESLASWRLDRRDPAEQVRRPKRSGQATSQSVRLGLVRAGDVTIVRVAVSNLLKEDIQADTAEQLDSLIAAGAHRIVINFAAVERLSSPFLNVILDAHRRCLEHGGGQLRLCAIRTELRAIFEVTGLEKSLAIYSDEAAALAEPWPGSGEPRPLPLSILTMLRRDAPGNDDHMRNVAARQGEATPPTSSEPRLRVESGRWAGMSLTLAGERLRIGRDRDCHLRCNAATVSRFHAEIERNDDGRMILRDLGSTNGTLHNEATLRSEEVCLSAGDRVQIGPMKLVVEADDNMKAPAPVDEQVADWLTTQTSSPENDDEENIDAETYAVEPEGSGITRTEIRCTVGSVRHEVIEGVLVVTPVGLPLDSEEGVEALRGVFQALLDSGMPRRVVVNLDTAGVMSSRAIGLLLAHALRLDGLGGALRIAQPQPRVRTWLEHLRIPLLIDVFASLDEAVIAAWG